MKNPSRAAFISLTRNLKKAADTRSLAELRRYIGTTAFRDGMKVLDHRDMEGVLKSYAKAYEKCVARAPLLPVGVARRANWQDPVFVAKFRRVYARTGSDEEVARLCGITPKAAQRARHRLIEAPATQDYARAA